MRRSDRFAAGLLLVAAFSTAAPAQAAGRYTDPDSPATEAAARAALPNAEIRRITGQTRKIEGVSGAIAGQVLSLEAVGRGLQAGGLTVRSVQGGLEVVLPGDVLFDFDKAAIRPSAIPVLEKVGTAARQAGSRPIRVEGHSDALGQPAYNQRLSKARADAVAQWLTQSGIPAGRLAAAGFGATRPVAPNRTPDGRDDPDGRQKNRRVTVTFSG